MSEPETKLDVKALSESLEETNIGGTVEDPTQNKPAEELARETMNKSNTLTIDAKSKKAETSPETLSPSSPTGEHPEEVLSSTTTTTNDASIIGKGKGSTNDASQTQPLDPTVQQIKNMFPDIEVDTIQAVVVAEDGDFERAINTLLQMSDPTYVPPPPRQSSQTERDEQLARSIAATEERQARSQRQFIPPSSGRGGALGSLLGLGGQEQQSQAQASYDPNQLSYQPRVRRTTSGQQGTYQSRLNHGTETYSSSIGSGEQTQSPFPGPREAKQWQEDINKFAEQGIAKAASTFSALRQRGEQAWATRQQSTGATGNSYNGQGQSYGNGAGEGMAGVGQKASSFFSNWNQRNVSGGSASTASPTIGSGRGFDRDPSPVSENELAKILARGRNEIGNGDGSQSGNGTGRKSSLSNIADRYKKVAAGQRQNSSSKVSTKEQEDDGNLGWDDAGRTDSNGKRKAFEPIRISDNSIDDANDSANIAKSQPQRTAVSLMESSTGRGITSPKANSQAEKQGYDLTHNDDDDDDDLEYVANPFEDED